MNKYWTAYWYVCTSCDTSMEVVTRRTKNRAPQCTCKHSHVVLCHSSKTTGGKVDYTELLITTPPLPPIPSLLKTGENK